MDGETYTLHPFDLEWCEVDRYEERGQLAVVHEGRAELDDADGGSFVVTWTVTESPPGIVFSVGFDVEDCTLIRGFEFRARTEERDDE